MKARKIRKQVYELSASDFAYCPIWEFALDEEGEEGQDEATVRPYKSNGALNAADGMFVIRARFLLADGTPMLGYLTPPAQGDSSIGTLQPIVLTAKGQVGFWCGVVAPGVVEIKARYKRLGKPSPTQVFPLKFESDVPLIGKVIKGQLPGFLVIEDLKTRQTKVVT